jgi:DNA-binding XRE family transcriptional regulator
MGIVHGKWTMRTRKEKGGESRMVDKTKFKDKPTLRDLRKQQCRQVTELAHKTGVHKNIWYRWETGDNAPSLRYAFTVAELFGKRVDEINWWPGEETG